MRSQHCGFTQGRHPVCIVGAGVAGISTAYALSRMKVPFDWFDDGSQPGGLWRYENDNGKSAVYASLITNTSAPNMRLFGHHKPSFGERYLRHDEAMEYLEWFLERTGLRELLTPGTAVTSVERTNAGFTVTTRSRSGAAGSREYGSVVIANGRNWCPVVPKFRGEFSGRFLHSAAYKTPEILKDQRVVVAGFGNTGADIAVDATSCARQVILSTRGGGFLSLRYSRGGKPADLVRRTWTYRLPRLLRTKLAWLLLPKRGLSPKVVEALEARAVFRAKPPVINDRIAGLIDSDAIQVRPEIVDLAGSRVRFADGSTVEADVLIAATGFTTSFPFFSDEMLERNGGFRDRYFRVVAPAEPGLYFVGHAAVLGPVWPVIEEQARWVAGLITGECRLPSERTLARRARAQSASNARICRESARGEDTVETYPYIDALKREHGLRAEYTVS